MLTHSPTFKGVLIRSVILIFKLYILACVSFEVLTVVTMKIGVFWNEKTCMYIVQKRCRNFLLSSSAPIMEAISSSGMSGHFILYQTISIAS